jgi:hypothetical protein
MRLVLRLTAGVLLVNSCVVIVTLLLGQFIQVEAVTDYLLIDARSYAVGIRDPMHNVYLPLAGRGCFETLPLDSEWIAVRQQYNPGFVQRFQIWGVRLADVLNRLRCVGAWRQEIMPQTTRNSHTAPHLPLRFISVSL